MISIIIPIYNAGKFLSICLGSVLNQTFTNWECLLIDDGSKDDSGTICEKYAQNDTRFKVFHNQNQGVSSSRQFGLERVNGDYFIFLDADDYVEPEYLEHLYNACVNNGAHQSVCSYVEEYEHEGIIVSVIQRDDKVGYICDLMRGRTWGVTWNKLFSTELARRIDLRFIPKIKMWEDLVFCIYYAMHCAKIVFVDEPLYHYVKYNVASITATEHESLQCNRNRVIAIEWLEERMTLEERRCYADDLRWLKFWIKDTFIRYKVDKERIELWRNSFPEVNNEYTQCDMSNNRLTAALVNEQYWYVYMHYYYYQTRHFFKKILTCVMKP